MKTLLLVRHAQSSQDGKLNDRDRFLDERGKREASEMAQRLLKRDVPFDLIISSPATRAKKTADFFMKAYSLSDGLLQLKEELYHPAEEAFFSVIEEISDDFNHPVIFSHNPGITHFVNLLCSRVNIDYMPTCGVFAIKTEVATWREFHLSPKTFWFFELPQTISNRHSSFI